MANRWGNVETVIDFIFLGSKTTADRDCIQKIRDTCPWEPVSCSMSSFNCCFLQISQEAGQVIWYSHLFQNFPQFVVIHKVKSFGIVNKAEVDGFLELY